MVLTAALTTDIEALCNRILALWNRCLSPDDCTAPDVLLFPYTENKGALFRSRARLQAIENSVLQLLENNCYPDNSLAMCTLLRNNSSALHAVGEGVSDADNWINTMNLLVQTLETRYSASSSESYTIVPDQSVTIAINPRAGRGSGPSINSYTFAPAAYSVTMNPANCLPEARVVVADLGNGFEAVVLLDYRARVGDCYHWLELCIRNYTPALDGGPTILNPGDSTGGAVATVRFTTGSLQDLNNAFGVYSYDSQLGLYTGSDDPTGYGAVIV